MTTEQPIIETKEATIQFDGLVAVDGVSFAMKEGEAIGIIGPNGAGKTTFFNLLTGLFFPTGGKIFFSGKDITAVPPHKRVTMGMSGHSSLFLSLIHSRSLITLFYRPIESAVPMSPGENFSLAMPIGKIR